jgi:hypothetical protein
VPTGLRGHHPPGPPLLRHRRAAPLYSFVRNSLTELNHTKKEIKYRWDEDQVRIFSKIKAMSKSAHVLRYPDWSKTSTLHTHGRKVGVGVFFSKTDGNEMEYAICFSSRMNSSAKVEFCSYEGEISTIVNVV